ncbi:hypothetical protein [Rossellomorea sp. FM04394]|uniref:hypothetical protein n=1 Tax=Rossellomorea sp. FM04394 TaxID=3243076 RepID=UPI0035A67EAC
MPKKRNEFKNSSNRLSLKQNQPIFNTILIVVVYHFLYNENCQISEWIRTIHTFGCETVKTIFRYILLAIIIFAAVLLYQLQLGAIPFFLLSFYLFYEAFRVIRNGDKEEEWESGRPS